MFLGLNGIAVKSHGGTDAVGFANAVAVAYDAVVQGLNERITKELSGGGYGEASQKKAAAT